MRTPFKVLAASLAVAASLLIGSAAGAVDNPDYTAPAPTQVVQNPALVAERAVAPRAAAAPAANAANAAASASAASRQRLAITGSDTAQLVALGSVLVAAGVGTLLLRRRATA